MSIDTAEIRAEMNRDHGLSADAHWLAGDVLPQALDEIDALRARLAEVEAEERWTEAEIRAALPLSWPGTASNLIGVLRVRAAARGEGDRG